MSAAIAIQNVYKSYGKQMVLLDIKAQFEQGQISGLIGRNGSGKSVLLKCICALTPTDSGRISLFDQPFGKGLSHPGSIGALINEPGFLPTVSGHRNLSMIASIRRVIGRQQIDESMHRVGLDPRSRKWVCKYSMGMRQRLGIAQAIMEEPKLLVLDEPMNGLDNKGVQDMRELFLDLKAQGTTILLASHNREDIEVLCDHVYEMDAGRLTQVRQHYSGRGFSDRRAYSGGLER